MPIIVIAIVKKIGTIQGGGDGDVLKIRRLPLRQIGRRAAFFVKPVNAWPSGHGV